MLSNKMLTHKIKEAEIGEFTYLLYSEKRDGSSVTLCNNDLQSI